MDNYLDEKNEDTIQSKSDTSPENCEALLNNLPVKSKAKYLKNYENFKIWISDKNVKTLSEEVLLEYFKHLAQSKLPSTLWASYSMLKPMIAIKHNVSISTYTSLLIFLKNLSKDFKPKGSKVLSSENIKTFLKEAPDYRFLATKAILIFGVTGACSVKELTKLTVGNIKERSDQLMLVTLDDEHTDAQRSFVIREKNMKTVEKYMALRPPDVNTDRLFLSYQKGICNKTVIGRNTITNVPAQIASYLKLPNPEQYTGNCFRKTSAAFSCTGLDMTLLRLKISPNKNK